VVQGTGSLYEVLGLLTRGTWRLATANSQQTHVSSNNVPGRCFSFTCFYGMTTLAWAFRGKRGFFFLFSLCSCSFFALSKQLLLLDFALTRRKERREGEEEGRKDNWDVWSEEGVLYYDVYNTPRNGAFFSRTS
jgi:hypothetical protein